jgi:hypothetical protein
MGINSRQRNDLMGKGLELKNHPKTIADFLKSFVFCLKKNLKTLCLFSKSNIFALIEINFSTYLP